MRLPKRSASTSSRRCIVCSYIGPDPGRTYLPDATAQNKMPQPRAAAPRCFCMNVKALSASAGAPQVVRRVVAGRALDRLVDPLHLVGEAHRDVAPGLQVVVHLHRGVEHRDVVPVLIVQTRSAPQLAAPVVLVDQHDRPAVLVDVERAPGVDVARALLRSATPPPETS